jgi:uncharacterized protein
MTHPIVYAELHTSNPGKARDFYKDLFGWGMKVHTEFDYTEVQPGSGPEAEMMGLTPHDGDRPQWVTYVGVPDLDVAAVRAPRTAVPGQGWFVWLDDPTGARVALWQKAQE